MSQSLHCKLRDVLSCSQVCEPVCVYVCMRVSQRFSQLTA